LEVEKRKYLDQTFNNVRVGKSGYPDSSLPCDAAPKPVCGDGVVEANEDCDPGVKVFGDGCSNTCEWECKTPETQYIPLVPPRSDPRTFCPPVGSTNLANGKPEPPFTNGDHCIGGLTDIDNNGDMDCMLSRVLDHDGDLVQTWCVVVTEDDQGNSIPPHFEYRGYKYGDPNKLIGRCQFPEGFNEAWIKKTFDCEPMLIVWRNTTKYDKKDLNKVVYISNFHDDTLDRRYYCDKRHTPGGLDSECDAQVPPFTLRQSLESTVNNPFILLHADTIPIGPTDPFPAPQVLPLGGPMSFPRIIRCDLDENGGCDAADQQSVTTALNACLGDAAYRPDADLNGDDCVTQEDLDEIFSDFDGDGIYDAADNCPSIANAAQIDTDEDYLGDACDEACQDGRDNDDDGLIDYPADTGCAYPNDPLEVALRERMSITSLSIPAGSLDSGSHPLNDNVWSMSVPPYPLDVDMGIGNLVREPVTTEAFSLHDHGYIDPHIPNPTQAIVTYQFEQPTVIDQVEIIQHANGVSQIEGYVGDSVGSLTSIGSIFGPLGDVTGSNVFAEGSSYVFDFNNVTPGRVFQFVVRKTSLANGWALYRAFPRDADGNRLLGAALEVCNDGIDNDGDGATDFPDDTGCSADIDDTETPPVVDVDGDGVEDAVDNCTAEANSAQRDTNGDGYGNMCDADLDQSGFVDFTDLTLFSNVFFSADADADLNGSGFVDFADLTLFSDSFFQAPGPSCCGTPLP